MVILRRGLIVLHRRLRRLVAKLRLAAARFSSRIMYVPVECRSEYHVICRVSVSMSIVNWSGRIRIMLSQLGIHHKSREANVYEIQSDFGLNVP